MIMPNLFKLYRNVYTLISLFFVLISSASVSADEIWINVDTSAQTLSVMRGDQVKKTFENIALGRYGTTWNKRTLDDKTPLGTFRIGWINEQSRYYRFFGLDYPNRENAQRALEENIITEETWRTILHAVDRDRTPPQNTELGGYIGIHGIGRGDPAIHEQFNWTNGCIALTNEQIDQLSKWLKPGVRVRIH
jgi:murein L,D-transpeptidase YafK